MTGSNSGKPYSVLLCSSICVAGVFSGVTSTCCTTDNCNVDNTLSTATTGTVSSCSTTSGDQTLTKTCTAPSNKYCVVNWVAKIRFYALKKLKKKILKFKNYVSGTFGISQKLCASTCAAGSISYVNPLTNTAVSDVIYCNNSNGLKPMFSFVFLLPLLFGLII